MENINDISVKEALERLSLPSCFDDNKRITSYFVVMEMGNPIQKIMSAPLIAEGKVVGVVQISRKGKNGPASGPDFTIKDLTALMATAGLLAKAINKK